MLLLIDNYDSFTYNLLHYFAESGAHVTVVRNDAISVQEIFRNQPEAIIISPGPGTPDEAGICLDLIRDNKGKIPIFGVCLGLQSIGQSYGGKIIRAPKPMHGKVSPIFHHQTGIFKNIPSPFLATRYHSLIVDKETLPECLEVTAWTDDGLIMGISHRTYPIHSVQFHPESIASEHGHTLIRNFLDMV